MSGIYGVDTYFKLHITLTLSVGLNTRILNEMARMVVVVVINRAFNCFKGEMKCRVERKSWLEGFRPRKVKGKIKIEKDRK